MTERLAYSGLADPSRWCLIDVLVEQGTRQPDVPWFLSTEGESLTFGAALADARLVAGYLASLGVGRGDRVAIILPNGADFVRVWLGVGVLGAVAVLINTELHGAFLEHQLRNCGAALAIADAALVATVAAAAAKAPELRRVIVVGTLQDGVGTLESVDFNDWRKATAWTELVPRPQDTCCILYTSGTSGPAKGVVMPHTHCTLYGLGAIKLFQLGPCDRYYITLPLFHVNGLLLQLGATLLAGIPAIVRPRFSASGWLADIRAHGATITSTLGTLCAFILAQEPRPDDRQHTLRAVVNAPNLPEHEAALRVRFGIRDVLSGYGMTEINIPVLGRLGTSRPGAAGWVNTEFFDLVVADPDTDQPVPSGAVGEILVRPKVPFGFMSGYHAMPEQTVEAWRNLWFHTGDAGTLGADGLLTFVDRIKDCIRRRGENISASEVESAVGGLPGIAEIAACAVPSGIAGAEDELLLSIVLAPGSEITPEAVAAHADAVLPRFAWPRFVEFVAELPKTSTGKVQRAVLRKRDHSRAWDRESN